MNTRLIHTVVNELTTRTAPKPAEGGLLDTLTTTNADLLGVLKNIGITVITVVLIMQALKAKAAIAAVIGAIFVGALLYFGLNGGFMWLSDQINQEVKTA